MSGSRISTGRLAAGDVGEVGGGQWIVQARQRVAVQQGPGFVALQDAALGHAGQKFAGGLEVAAQKADVVACYRSQRNPPDRGHLTLGLDVTERALLRDQFYGARIGVRAGDVLDPAAFANTVKVQAVAHNSEITALGGRFVFDDDKTTPDVLNCSYVFGPEKKMVEFEVRPWRTNTEEGATREAERLARANPGQTFIVMESVGALVVDNIQRTDLRRKERGNG